MDAFVQLAKLSIERYLETGRIIGVPENTPVGMLNNKAGVFVSLHRRQNHELRGCIGTFEPNLDTIAEEIIHNAVSAAVDDPRFPPVKPEEIADLAINVDVLSEPEIVNDISLLNPKKYGLIVVNGRGQRGLLLPDIGVETVDEQIDICCEKGGINRKNDRLTFYRFTVERHV
ncbi:MAG: AmmeMemoRadiSam system protein A [Patescibacteria group bacterium]